MFGEDGGQSRVYIIRGRLEGWIWDLGEYWVRETYETIMERPLDVDLLRFAGTWNTYLPLKKFGECFKIKFH
jgi:hypothetical protein